MDIDDMNLKEKIICCHGNLTGKSTSIVLGCGYHYVLRVWADSGLKNIRKNEHRSYSGYYS